LFGLVAVEQALRASTWLFGLMSNSGIDCQQFAQVGCLGEV
jgi:hypothetical protein